MSISLVQCYKNVNFKIIRDQTLARESMPDVQRDKYIAHPFCLKAVFTLAQLN